MGGGGGSMGVAKAGMSQTAASCCASDPVLGPEGPEESELV